MDFGNNMEISVAKHLIVSLFWILDAHPCWIRAFYRYKIKTNKIIVEDGLKFKFETIENSKMVIDYLFRLLAKYFINNTIFIENSRRNWRNNVWGHASIRRVLSNFSFNFRF